MNNELKITAVICDQFSQVQIALGGVVIGTMEFLTSKYDTVKKLLGTGAVGVSNEGIKVGFLEKDLRGQG